MTVQSGEIRISYSAMTNGGNNVQAQVWDPTVASVLALTVGTGANQFNEIYVLTRSLAPAASEDLDLNGALTDAFGSTISMVELVAGAFLADSGNNGDMVVGGATNPVPLFSDATDKFPVKPGGFFAFAAPNAAGQATVTAGTGDKIKVAYGGTGANGSYTVVLFGRNA